jgi:hypothetical protein
VDPDDWVAPDFYERLYEKAVSSRCDIIKGKTIGLSWPNGERVLRWEYINDRMRMNLAKHLPLYCVGGLDHFSALYRATLFSDGDVRYGSARKGEDMTFLLRVFHKTDSIAFEDTAIYYYRVERENSATQSYSSQRIDYELDTLAEQIAFFEGREMDAYAYAYLARRIQMVVNSYCGFAALSGSKRSMDAAFVHKLMPIVRGIPDYERMAAFTQELHALLTYGYPIPTRPHDAERFGYDHIVRWTDLLVEIPSARKNSTGAFVTAIFKTVFENRNGQRPNLHNRAFHALVRAQLSRLGLYYTIWVFVCIPFVFAALAAKILVARIRIMFFGRSLRSEKR